MTITNNTGSEADSGHEKAKDDNKRTATSQKQIEANRRNARRSTGPRTEEGKARSSRNAARHGAFGLPIAVPRGPFREDPEAVAEGVEGLVATLKPTNPLAWAAAYEVAATRLRLERLARLEAERIAGASPSPEPESLEAAVSCLEQIAMILEANDADLSPAHWREVAVFIATQEGDDATEALADQDLEGETLARDDPTWESIARDLIERFYGTPEATAHRARTQASVLCETIERHRRASEETALARATADLLDGGALETCSLIRARLGRELDRAYTHFQAMQRLGG